MSRGPKRGRTESAFASPPPVETRPVLHDAPAIEADAPHVAACTCGECLTAKEADTWHAPPLPVAERKVPAIRERGLDALAKAEAEVAAVSARLDAIRRRQDPPPLAPALAQRQALQDRVLQLRGLIDRNVGNPTALRALAEEWEAIRTRLAEPLPPRDPDAEVPSAPVPLTDAELVALDRERIALQAKLALAEQAAHWARTIVGLGRRRDADHRLRREHGDWLREGLTEMERNWHGWRMGHRRDFDEMYGRLVGAQQLLATNVEAILQRVALAQESDEPRAVARVLAGDPEIHGAMTPDGESAQAREGARIIDTLRADWPAFRERATQALPADAQVVSGLSAPLPPREPIQTHALTGFDPRENNDE